MSEKYTVKLTNEIIRDVKDKSFKIEVIAETEDKDESIQNAYEMMRMMKHKVRTLQAEKFD